MNKLNFKCNVANIFLLGILLFTADVLAQLPPKEYFKNGQPKLEYTQLGDDHIARKEYYENGQLKSQGFYRNNQLSGNYKEYFEDGTIYLDMNFLEGKEDGNYKEYTSDAQLKKECNFKEGVLNGFYQEYSDSGELAFEYNFVNNQRQGNGKVYYPSGKLKVSLIFENDVLNGDYEEFDENGSIILKGVMQNGVISQDSVSSTSLAEVSPSALKKASFSDSESVFKNVLPGVNRFIGKYESEIKKGRSVLFYVLIVIGIIVVLSALYFLGNFYAPEQNTGLVQIKRKNDSVDIPKNINYLNDEATLLMYRRLVENVKSGIFVADLSGNLIFANYALMDILGIKAKTDILGFNINDRFLGMDNQKRMLLEKIEKMGAGQFKFIGNKEDPIVLSVKGSFIFNEKGVQTGIQGVIQDVTQEASLEESLLDEKKKLDQMLKIFEQVDTIKEFDSLVNFIVMEMADLFRANRCSIMLTSKDGLTLDVVGACGINDPDIVSSKINITDTISGLVSRNGQAVLVKNIEYDKQFQQLRKKTPSYLGRSFMIAPLEHNDQVIGVINVSEKKAEIKNAQPFDEVDLRILQHMAIKIAASVKNVELFNELNLMTHTDPLTQIYNYRLLSESLDREIKRFKREKYPLCVFMMDLDSFKSYNDTFGHLEGDELLKGLGSILKNSLRDTDIACRYAGDEFCAILPNTDSEGVKNAAAKVIKSVAEHAFKRQVTISIGAAMYEEAMTKKDFLAKADKALYQAKHSGKNQVVILP